MKTINEKLAVLSEDHNNLEMKYKCLEHTVSSKEDELGEAQGTIEKLNSEASKLIEKAENTETTLEKAMEEEKSQLLSCSDLERRCNDLESALKSKQDTIDDLQEQLRCSRKTEQQQNLDKETINLKVTMENEELYQLNANLEAKILDMKDNLANEVNKTAQREEDLEVEEAKTSELNKEINHLKVEIVKAKEDAETFSFEMTEKETQ